MKQTKISYWLKGIVILLGLMGIAFFGGLTYYAFGLKGKETSGMFWTFIFSSWYIASLCYEVLIEFWRVCTQIGKDNSFSMENARSFHRMGICGGLAAGGFVVRLCYMALMHALTPVFTVFVAAEIMIAIIFIVLCEALSKLILNAYEMKQENDLTI